jgi:hypothetical protein
MIVYDTIWYYVMLYIPVKTIPFYIGVYWTWNYYPQMFNFFRTYKMEAYFEEEAQTYCCYFGQILRAASYFKG